MQALPSRRLAASFGGREIDPKTCGSSNIVSN